MLYGPSKGALCQQFFSKSERGVNKLVSISATITPLTGTREEVVENFEMAKSAGASKDGKESGGKYLENLARVSYIRYLINFRKKSVWALFDLTSKVNTDHPAFTKRLCLSIRPTNIGVQKIDGTILDTYKMRVAAFLVKDKAN